jgi:transcriptional regulator with XRE-family HTH domain
MTLTNAIQERIKGLCTENGITINKLSTISGMTQSTLNNIFMRENSKPTVSTIKKICDGLEISLLDFFDSDFFVNLEQEVK